MVNVDPSRIPSSNIPHFVVASRQVFQRLCLALALSCLHALTEIIRVHVADWISAFLTGLGAISTLTDASTSVKGFVDGSETLRCIGLAEMPANFDKATIT